MARLTKKQHNTIMAKALSTAAKQVESLGTEDLPKGSYPFEITPEIVGELDVKAGTPAGEDKTVADMSDSDLIIAMHASYESYGSLLSDAMGWWKNASSEQKKEHKAASKNEIMRVAKRRKMTSDRPTPARPGAASAKPRVKIADAQIATRTVSAEVAAK